MAHDQSGGFQIPPETLGSQIWRGLGDLAQFIVPPRKSREQLMQENIDTLDQVNSDLARTIREKEVEIKRSRALATAALGAGNGEAARFHVMAIIREQRAIEQVMKVQQRNQLAKEQIRQGKVTQQITQCLRRNTEILYSMNLSMSGQQVNRIMMENERQMSQFETKQDMINDALDDSDKLDDGEIDTQVQSIVDQLALEMQTKSPAPPTTKPLGKTPVRNTATAAAAAATQGVFFYAAPEPRLPPAQNLFGNTFIVTPTTQNTIDCGEEFPVRSSDSEEALQARLLNLSVRKQ